MNLHDVIPEGHPLSEQHMLDRDDGPIKCLHVHVVERIVDRLNDSMVDQPHLDRASQTVHILIDEGSPHNVVEDTQRAVKRVMQERRHEILCYGLAPEILNTYILLHQWCMRQVMQSLLTVEFQQVYFHVPVDECRPCIESKQFATRVMWKWKLFEVCC